MTAPVTVDLDWRGDLRFAGRTGSVEMILDSAGQAGPTPVEALALSLAGCMAIDVVHILKKGRLDPRAVHAHLIGERAREDPKRLVTVTLHFAVTGDIPAEKLERALSLSREKYCSVWHSLRPDLDFKTSFEIVGGTGG
ncbi:MAG TPA: OsmC family protein [Vicinamibacteria bacterium]|jgi:putative redox protein|nr:OsmC family protein [Vicinamibacteria bacterium]